MEDYVKFETAKLLKEKRFNEPCIATYNLVTKDFEIEEVYQDWTNQWPAYMSAPTLQMAMKWLETTYGKFICIDKHFYTIDKISHIASGVTYSYEIKHINSIHKETGFTTYEEACEAAIKYCLEKLI